MDSLRQGEKKESITKVKGIGTTSSQVIKLLIVVFLTMKIKLKKQGHNCDLVFLANLMVTLLKCLFRHFGQSKFVPMWFDHYRSVLQKQHGCIQALP